MVKSFHLLQADMKSVLQCTFRVRRFRGSRHGSGRSTRSLLPRISKKRVSRHSSHSGSSSQPPCDSLQPGPIDAISHVSESTPGVILETPFMSPKSGNIDVESNNIYPVLTSSVGEDLVLHDFSKVSLNDYYMPVLIAIKLLVVDIMP